MTIGKDALPWAMSRRQLLAGSAGAGLLATGVPGTLLAAPTAQGALDTTNWTPEYIASIAGTVTVDTAADCAKVVPLNYKGRLSYWYVGPNQASPQIDRDMDAAFWAAFAKTYPNITVDKQNLDYNEMLNK